eukprot:GHVP01069056.1.p1 GENE.GHVP01069056.1~~GHVP01069056.1.p1  ORF type:complete len:128 (+),score=10.60 GHVP01069056.1:185-568(+)
MQTPDPPYSGRRSKNPWLVVTISSFTFADTVAPATPPQETSDTAPTYDVESGQSETIGNLRIEKPIRINPTLLLMADPEETLIEDLPITIDVHPQSTSSKGQLWTNGISIPGSKATHCHQDLVPGGQ